ncbi:MAG: hypothetical protein NZ899_02780 [Thermoguttaceae bacterium]|nr:hypothetical protein [Thermoguttaceae bacterium]MDW8079748.1 hypothetical protein [Thermoguttaceae bacterium]
MLSTLTGSVLSLFARGVIQQLSSSQKNGPSSEGITAPGRTDALDELKVDGNSRALKRVLSRYELTRISPAELRQLAAELGEKALLSPSDIQELFALSRKLEAAGIGTHERVNLLAWCQRLLRDLERKSPPGGPETLMHEPSEAVAQLRRQVALLEKLASLQELP